MYMQHPSVASLSLSSGGIGNDNKIVRSRCVHAKPPYTYKYTHTHTHNHTNTHAHANKHTHKHTNTQTHKCCIPNLPCWVCRKTNTCNTTTTNPCVLKIPNQLPFQIGKNIYAHTLTPTNAPAHPRHPPTHPSTHKLAQGGSGGDHRYKKSTSRMRWKWAKKVCTALMTVASVESQPVRSSALMTVASVESQPESQFPSFWASLAWAMFATIHQYSTPFPPSSVPLFSQRTRRLQRKRRRMRMRAR